MLAYDVSTIEILIESNPAEFKSQQNDTNDSNMGNFRVSLRKLATDSPCDLFAKN